MIQFLFIIILVLNAVMAVKNKKSKVVVILTVVVLTLIFAYSSTEAGDLSRYNHFYYKGIRTDWDAGYVWISQLFSTVGFSFNEFRMFLCLCGLLVIQYSVKGIINNYHIFMLLYILCIFFFFAIALRNYMSFVLIILSFRFLYKRKLLLFVFFVVLAGFCHTSGLFCLGFAIVLLKESALKKIRTVLRVINAVGIVFICALTFSPSVYDTIAGIYMRLVTFLGNEELELIMSSYSSVGYARIRILYPIIYIANYYCLTITRRYLANNDPMSAQLTSYVETIYLICMLVLPVIMLSQTMIRITFYGFILSYIAYAKACDINRISHKEFLISRKHYISYSSYLALITLPSMAMFVRVYFIGDFSFNVVKFLLNNTLI